MRREAKDVIIVGSRLNSRKFALDKQFDMRTKKKYSVFGRRWAITFFDEAQIYRNGSCTVRTLGVLYQLKLPYKPASRFARCKCLVSYSGPAIGDVYFTPRPRAINELRCSV